MSHVEALQSLEPAAKRLDWGRAFRAIRTMQTDPSRTDQVFELTVALDGGDSARMFESFRAEPGADALLAERPLLLDRLADFDRLRALPPDSLGATYLRLMEGNGYSADGLRREAAKVAEFAELHPTPERMWFAERQNCVHDLLHALTGYGQDAAGETALLAFNDGMFSQRFRFRVIRFGVIASLLTSPPRSWLRALRVSWQARRRGARSAIPLGERWEARLAQPLAVVQRELRVAPIARAHPAGILRGDDEPWRFAPSRVHEGLDIG